VASAVYQEKTIGWKAGESAFVWLSSEEDIL
jgi:hypothetical protein